MQSTREFVESVARNASRRPLYLDRDPQRDGSFYRALCALIGEKKRVGHWRMENVRRSKRLVRITGANRRAADVREWAFVVFYGGVGGSDDMRVVQVARDDGVAEHLYAASRRERISC